MLSRFNVLLGSVLGGAVSYNGFIPKLGICLSVLIFSPLYEERPPRWRNLQSGDNVFGATLLFSYLLAIILIWCNFIQSIDWKLRQLIFILPYSGSIVMRMHALLINSGVIQLCYYWWQTCDGLTIFKLGPSKGTSSQFLSTHNNFCSGTYTYFRLLYGYQNVQKLMVRPWIW